MVKDGPSPDALALARIYDALDEYGRDALRAVARAEKRRCKDEARLLRETAPPWRDEPKSIREYPLGASDALLSGVEKGRFTFYDLRPTDPTGADFAVQIRGDSALPFFPDGIRVFADYGPLEDGDIGFFSVDGALVIRQYHYDAALGMTYLFALNRACPELDIVLPPTGGKTVISRGRVIPPVRVPLPGM